MKTPLLPFPKIKALVLGCFLFCNCAKAQYVTIPDANFVAWLNANGYATCMVGNQMDTTCSVILSATTLDCTSSSLSDITGIQYFHNLTSLNCQGNFNI